MGWCPEPAHNLNYLRQLRQLVAFLRNSQFFHTIPERAGMQIKNLSGATATFNDPVSLFQHCQNVLSFNRFKAAAVGRVYGYGRHFC